MKIVSSAWLLAAATAFTTTMAATITYPLTPKIPHTDSYFGTDIADPYHWLEDDNSEQTKAWSRARTS